MNQAMNRAMNEEQLKLVVEGALLAAGRSLSLDNLQQLFEEGQQPEKGALKKAIDALSEDYTDRSIEIKETSSGFRIQVKQQFSQWVSRLWEERPTRYSRALLETLALVAYRQPITRAEIEDVRGVSVSTSIIRTLQERDWVRVVGHRDVPGRPAMYGTTRTFLDYFGLKSLDELPTLAELRDIDSINVELDLDSRPDAKPDVAAVDIKSTGDAAEAVETEATDNDDGVDEDGFEESLSVEVHAGLSDDELAGEHDGDEHDEDGNAPDEDEIPEEDFDRDPA